MIPTPSGTSSDEDSIANAIWNADTLHDAKMILRDYAERLASRRALEARYEELQRWPKTFREHGRMDERLYESQAKILERRMNELQSMLNREETDARH